MDPIAAANYGLLAASRRFEASAVRTAQMGMVEVDYAQEVVEQVSAKQQFSAMIGVIRTADEMWDSLLAIQSDHR
jgi:flagellar hook protein FlgE